MKNNKKNNSHKQSKLSQLSPDSKLLLADLAIIAAGRGRPAGGGSGGGDILVFDIVDAA
ncbi:hypothetical protein [Anabaena sp. CCY 0017]|uniref:hypothetical protein n=1 Tax=Anabaena sp. CCY 0017 TaxID=3103866 RepID=UPI0039C61B57